ncbi:MAG: DEAD/DEAH box helicase [Deltaproteobacteria bacterium]|nr:DEAD/DEAH box helicase [Deltaproteobacteria bacterium]
MTTDFEELKLHPKLMQSLTDLGYNMPTPIQSIVIPVMMEGKDVIGQSQTGTGKTAAFSLPIIQNLIPGKNHIQGLIVTPTRELAIQVAEAIHQYGHHLGVRVLSVYGGQPYARQINRLKKGIDIVVGTPGRLIDLIGRKSLNLSGLSTLVLDEADEMLSMGFIEDIETILNETPENRQTALFSATMPRAIQRLADRYMRDPKSFADGNKHLTVDSTEQRYYLINEKDKIAALTRLLEIEQISTALIFTRTRIGTGELAAALTERGFPSEALNGDMSQDARIGILNRFRRNQIKVLVATDVAARGLDIDDISHVFNYDMPNDPEMYVHRIGRTGRAGKTGIAISLIIPANRRELERIEAYTRQKISRAILPKEEDILSYRDAKLLEQMTVWLNRGRCRREREILEKLVAEGHDLIDLSAIALKLARAEEKKRPIAPIDAVQEYTTKKTGRSNKRFKAEKGSGRPGNSRKKESNSHHAGNSREVGMVPIILNTGRTNGIRANHIMGTLSYHADIPGSSLGRISIHSDHTLVDVPKEFVSQVLAKTGSYRFGRQTIDVERA